MLPSKKAVQAILRESVFNPRETGHLSIIIEDASADYIVHRAQEILRTIQSPQGASTLLRDAISLLAYARALGDGS